jgi:uncharacterized membrane protein required for colicin V production
MIIDIAALLLVLILGVKGFRSGFTPSLFGVVGYLIGALAGLIAAQEITSSWEGFWSLIGVHLLLILIGAKVGEVLARLLGQVIRKVIGPFRIIDSLFGLALGFLRAAAILFIASYILSIVPNPRVESEVKESRVINQVVEVLPSSLSDAFSKLSEVLNLD